MPAPCPDSSEQPSRPSDLDQPSPTHGSASAMSNTSGKSNASKVDGRVGSTLRELTRRAGRWLGLAEAPAPVKHTGAVVSDGLHTMAWRDTYEQAGALRELAEDLNERYDYTTDLLADTFLGAYKAAPQVRPATEMDPSRAVNHQVITTMMASPEFAELRRETAGAPSAAAMAVLVQGEALRAMVDRAKDAHDRAQEQADAQRQADAAAQAVAAA